MNTIAIQTNFIRKDRIFTCVPSITA